MGDGMRVLRCPPAYPRGQKTIGPKARKLAEDIARAYGLTFNVITGPSLVKAVAWPRQHVMAALREQGYSETQIGLLLNRDASTVSFGSARHLERAAWADIPEIEQPDLFAEAA